MINLNWKKILLIFGMSIGPFLILFYLYIFLTNTNLTPNSLYQKITKAWQVRPYLSQERINFLILGLDRRNDSLERTLLTDTIIFASLDTQQSRLTVISIPRDLWLNHLKTKINALYYYGQKREELTGEITGPELLASELSKIIKEPVHYWMLIDYQDFGELVDIVNGVDVVIEKGFEDDKFPNINYIQDPNLSQYKIVKFESGVNHLDGQRALEFVRSRSSLVPEEGSDVARSSRQLQLFNSFVGKLTKNKTLLSPWRMAQLYSFWQNRIETSLKDEYLIAILLELSRSRKNIAITHVTIPTIYEPKGAILVHPSVKKYNQWVWEPEDKDWSEFQEFIRHNIK